MVIQIPDYTIITCCFLCESSGKDSVRGIWTTTAGFPRRALAFYNYWYSARQRKGGDRIAMNKMDLQIP
ncbi:hypothetical protein RHGRI_008365 [Rhododendron griersonianum]|uniref:Uncharacterized protein n=1 Tax=Rhododendron griersonianum TaxID=479676 RepID=A0AAV6L233_9ERIC|nr:hypothetical protein RHGRI_037013 [Rhododendron griersonianum]KAG5558408.1 hypothetical protein RHGRI_008365 [Rhododendron griersonianum]